MSLLDDIQAKADANGDGKINADDLNSLKDQLPTDLFDQVKGKLDASGDGKVGLDDLKSIDFNALGDQAKDLLGKVGDFFGKK